MTPERELADPFTDPPIEGPCSLPGPDEPKHQRALVCLKHECAAEGLRGDRGGQHVGKADRENERSSEDSLANEDDSLSRHSQQARSETASRLARVRDGEDALGCPKLRAEDADVPALIERPDVPVVKTAPVPHGRIVIGPSDRIADCASVRL
jgi:hypothetical protein